MVDAVLPLGAISVNSALDTLVGCGVAQISVLIAIAMSITGALNAQTIASLAVLSGGALRVRLAPVIDDVMRILLFCLLSPASPEQDNQNGCNDDNTDNDSRIPVETEDLSIRTSTFTLG